MTATVPGVRIDAVKIGERARKDYGDLERLKASIVEHGLLQPVVLLPDDYLLCGGRRLEACRQLGWDSIPFVRSATQTDAISRLRAERDENTCRKEMTPSELVAIGKKLEELKRPEAEERQGTRTDLTSGPVGPEVAYGHTTRREVAEAVGMTEGTYKRAKRVVEVAENDGEDPEVRKVAIHAQAQMDAGTISISAAEKKVVEAQVEATDAGRASGRVWVPQEERAAQIRALADSGRTSGQIGDEIGISEEQVRNIARKNSIAITADRVMNRSRRGIDSNHIVQETVNTLEGLLIGIGLVNFDDLDATQTENWAASLTAATTRLKTFAKQIKETTQ